MRTFARLEQVYWWKDQALDSWSGDLNQHQTEAEPAALRQMRQL